jgi:inosine-uridine nucleoside N-ribohydrolase
VDTDVALGAARGDVDDGFALAALLCAHRAGSARVLGISTVSGNTSAARAEECAARLCEAAGVKVALARDAEAAERLAVLPEGTDLLALGPLTNIARACRLDPRLPDRISLRAVGGNLSSRGFLPPLWPYEFNMARDPSAAREVFRGAWKGLLLFPLDVVRRVRADEQRLESLARLSSLGAYLARGSLRWLVRARRFRESASFPVWDLPAALDTLGLTRPPRSLVKPPHRGRYFGNREEVASVSSCDPTEHWEAFETLLASSETPSERLDSATKGS